MITNYKLQLEFLSFDVSNCQKKKVENALFFFDLFQLRLNILYIFFLETCVCKSTTNAFLFLLRKVRRNIISMILRSRDRDKKSSNQYLELLHFL